MDYAKKLSQYTVAQRAAASNACLLDHFGNWMMIGAIYKREHWEDDYGKKWNSLYVTHRIIDQPLARQAIDFMDKMQGGVMSEELKPCPFHERNPMDDGPRWATSNKRDGIVCPWCGVSQKTAEKWNTRPLEDAMGAEIARLHDLLALIHRDGGQYLDTHGIDKACADAVAKVCAWRDAQDELDRLRESTRWVPVGDGLPKDGETVDVCGDGFRRTDIVYTPCDHPPGCCTGIWWDSDGDEVYGVTHWMPLPEPPTADKGGA